MCLGEAAETADTSMVNAEIETTSDDRSGWLTWASSPLPLRRSLALGVQDVYKRFGS